MLFTDHCASSNGLQVTLDKRIMCVVHQSDSFGMPIFSTHAHTSFRTDTETHVPKLWAGVVSNDHLRAIESATIVIDIPGLWIISPLCSLMSTYISVALKLTEQRSPKAGFSRCSIAFANYVTESDLARLNTLHYVSSSFGLTAILNV